MWHYIISASAVEMLSPISIAFQNYILHILEQINIKDWIDIYSIFGIIHSFQHNETMSNTASLCSVVAASSNEGPAC